MKVVHSAGWYFPESTGGTEVYVSQLIRALKGGRIDGVVAAARDGYESDTYTHEGIDVFRYPVHPNPKSEQLRGLVPYGGFEVFANWLSEQKPDIYHQHSFVGGCGIHQLRRAHELGLRTVATVHLPGAICMRGTMMLYGQTACDGRVERVRCGVCWGMSRGLPHAVAALTARIPNVMSHGVAKTRLPGLSVLATPSLVGLHKAQLEELALLADRTIAISQWLYDALLINGFPAEKLVLCQTGAPGNSGQGVANRTKVNGHLRVGFLGRWDKLKGVDVLVSAVRNLPAGTPIELIIHGLPANGDDDAYEREVRLQAAGDGRIRFAEPVRPEQIADTLGTFDVLAIPSQCLETGPLVALEAQAAKVPIIASDLGGLAERIRHGGDGLLVPAADISAWTNALLQLAENGRLLARLEKGIRPIRTMADVASDVATIYREVLN
jgi:glycosyltransferase involved in cell wall biosynthesis